MSRDYKTSDRKRSARSGGGSLLLGILIGLVMGLAIALGVAWYINKMPNPFVNRAPAPAKAEGGRPGGKGDDKAAPAADQKPRFDFYKILPGSEEPATEQQMKDAQKSAPSASKDLFFLQVGAFSSAPEADNLKAKLALLGVEASIQTNSVPDKGTLHRVRIGPYGSVEELNKSRAVLKDNGIETTLIKVRESDK
jgi:cell division protein FtsN